MIDNLNTKQGYFDRLLLRGLCDNAKRKGKDGGRENTYKSTKLKSNYENYIVTYKKGGCEDFASGLAQNSHPFVSIYFFCLGVCLLAERSDATCYIQAHA